MDAEEEADVTGVSSLDSLLNASVAETFGHSLSEAPSFHAAPTVILPLSYDIVCAHCGRATPYVEPTNIWTNPDAPTIDNIGWYCSPNSSSTTWFKVGVGRRIGVFDNWSVNFLSILHIF